LASRNDHPGSAAGNPKSIMPPGAEQGLPEVIVTQPQELAAICSDLASCSHFGFDTEFVGEQTYHPRLCLVQVATSEKLILIDPMTVGPLDAFWDVVVDPAHVVIVHAGREEVRLCHLWTGRTPGNLFDLQIAAGLVGLAYPLSHASLVSQLLDVQMVKGETLTEWRDRPLRKQQIRYAFDDVRHLLPLWQQLAGRLERHGRAEWAREEFDRLAVHAAPEEPTGDKWRKLRGLGTLDRRRLAIVRELYHWRNETAARSNRPARTIVRDDLLIEIARRDPGCQRDLQVIRGLPRRDLAAIVEVVHRARTLSLEECPAVAERDHDPPQVTLVTNVLTAVLGDFCARNQLAANLVASSHDVKLLVRSRLLGVPQPTGSVLCQGWRSRHVLPELLAVLDGRRSVRIADVTADAPFVVEECSPP
jgi:ribonuclease D